MRKVKLVDGVYWVGAVDWDRRHFHGFSYSTKNGTTYNAYLIMGEKTALVDTVLPEFFDDLYRRISEITDPARIDYIIANHVEMDHSGSLPRMLEIAPEATVVCSAKAKAGLEKHYNCDCRFQVVKTGDSLDLGGKTLDFIEAPMIHWPDSMFTYLREEQLLLPNDAFGQHYASSQRFDDEVDAHIIMDEAAKYYANILMDLSGIINKKVLQLEESGIPVKMIAPSHGLIWRKDISGIVSAYKRWSEGKADTRKVVVVYDTMWQSTERMARTITEELSKEGLDARLYFSPLSDHSDIFKDFLDAKGIIIGSSTIHNSYLPTLASFIHELTTFKPKNKIGACFGSYGWGRGACRDINKSLEAAGVAVVMPPLEVQYIPDSKALEDCVKFAAEFAAKLS